MVVIKSMKSTSYALDFSSRNCSMHFYERRTRIARTGLGIGKVVSCFLVDKGHENGLEEHYITTSGLIVVRNHSTHKAVTVMIARPAQIRRYYKEGEKVPEMALQAAHYNAEVRHLNY